MWRLMRRLQYSLKKYLLNCRGDILYSSTMILVVQFPFTEHQDLSMAYIYSTLLTTDVNKSSYLRRWHRHLPGESSHWRTTRHGSTAREKPHSLGTALHPGGFLLCLHQRGLLPRPRWLCRTRADRTPRQHLFCPRSRRKLFPRLRCITLQHGPDICSAHSPASGRILWETKGNQTNP